MHTGCQWENLAIKTGMDGLTEIHYSRIYSKFRYWEATGLLANICASTVEVLNNKQLLDLSIIHATHCGVIMPMFILLPRHSNSSVQLEASGIREERGKDIIPIGDIDVATGTFGQHLWITALATH
jgi:hypothetical protein